MRKSAPWFEALLKEIEEKECSLIRARFDSSVLGGANDYKVYVNRNVRTTPPRLMDVRETGEELIPIQPGECTVVVRESEVHKENRLESNTLSLNVLEKEEIILKVLNQNGALVLINENS